MPKGKYRRPSLRERFEARVDRRGPDECWPWLAGRSADGYGVISEDYQQIGAHVVAFFFEHGRWPEPMCLHQCDNRPCCNPAHLREGTHEENMREMVARGRSASGARAARHRARLSERDIPVIRALREMSGFSQAEIAREYGVSPVTIHDVVARVSWGHI